MRGLEDEGLEDEGLRIVDCLFTAYSLHSLWRMRGAG
jgi:hypothetical protein